MWDIWRLCGLGYLHDRWKGVSLFLTLLKKSCSNNKASCLYINPPENLLHPPKPRIVLKVICMWQYKNDKMTLKYFKYSKTVSLIGLELWAYLFERALRWAVKMQHREEVWEEFQVSSSLSVQHATLPPNSASAQRDWPRCCAKRPLSPPHPSLSLSIGFQAKNERTSRKSGGASGWGKKKKQTGDAGLQRLTSNCCTLHCYSVLGGANLLTTQTSAHIRTSGKRVVSDAERSKLIVIVLQPKTDALSYNLLMISPQEVSSNIRKYWEIKHEHKM